VGFELEGMIREVAIYALRIQVGDVSIYDFDS
jgi:hypothetical protein